jgi:hypothetical protein
MDVRGLLDFKLGETPFDNINEIIILKKDILVEVEIVL